ncbi:MAG: sulfatase-like hydrolase/transferase [Deltaproteobacteria bacterium]|nr:sulfatase-like hydrolase/transferase [Deltaproteobacteria bacterium]
MISQAMLSRAWAELRREPIDPLDVGLAPLAGAPIVAVVNVVAAWVVLGIPASPWLRLQHHAWDTLATLVVSAWLALPGAGLAVTRWQLARRRIAPGARATSRRWDLAGLGLHAVVGCLGMHAILGDHFRRQADAFLDGRLASPLHAAMLLGAGLGLVVAQLLGRLARACSREVVRTTLIAALAALVAHHVTLRDDYPNVHTGITWAAATVFGAPLATDLRRLLEARPWRLRVLLALAGVGTLLEPSNAVRLELFRECGAVAPWVLARTVWRLPPETMAAPRLPTSPQLDPRRQVEPTARRAPLTSSPVVVLVTIDALRADVLSSREHEARLPNLTKLKQTGFYVSRAVAAGSQTSVSLASLFSGRTYSGQRWSLHGVGGARFLYPAEDPTTRIPARLADSGVKSESFLALQFLDGDFGVARGFGVEHMLTSGRSHGPASAVMPPLLAALDHARADEPRFLFAHLTEPHEPYDRGRVRVGTSWERYLSEVEVVDGWIGQLLDRMRAHTAGRGYLIVSADHGEAFGEHGTTFHTKTLYDELLRVPLVIWGPRLSPRRCDTLASLTDLGPTVLDLFGAPVDPSSLGESLLPLMLHERPCDAPRLPVVAEGRLRRALYTQEGLKVIEDHVHRTVEVYDLTRDPRELTNLYPDDPRSRPALAALRATFEARALPNYRPPYKP